MEERIRRTVSEWGSAPTDGTPFHILNTMRFNPLAKRFEILALDDDNRHVWRGVSFERNAPTKWLRLVPLPYEVPTSFAFTMTYEVQPKRWRDRIVDRVFRRWHASAFHMLVQHEIKKAVSK